MRGVFGALVATASASTLTWAASPCTSLGPDDALLVIDVQNSFLEERPASGVPQYPIPPEELVPGPSGGQDIKAGSLAVPGSAPVVPRVQAWYDAFASAGAQIYASADFHPADHCSFCRNGTAQSNPQGFKPDGAICVSGVDVPIDVMNATRRCHDNVSDYDFAHDNYYQWPDHCVQGTFGQLFDPYLAVPASTVQVLKGFDMWQDSYSAFGGRLATNMSLDLYAALTTRVARRLWVVGVALDFCVSQSTLDALGANPRSQRPAPPTLDHVILVQSATAVRLISSVVVGISNSLTCYFGQAVNQTAGAAAVRAVQAAGGFVATAVDVQGAIAQFCGQV